MVTEAAGIDDDVVILQVVEVANTDGLVLGRCHALRKQRYGVLAIATVFIVEAGGETHHKVRLAVAQVGESLGAVSELDSVGDAKLIHQQLDDIDVEAFRLALVIKERIGIQVPGILIDQRMFLGICARHSWRLCAQRGKGCKHAAPQKPHCKKELSH